MPLLILLDITAWLVATYLAAAFRLETWQVADALTAAEASGAIPLQGTLALGVTAALLHIFVSWVFRLHQGRSGIGSFEEMFVLGTILAFVGTIVVCINAFMAEPFLPRTTPAIAACFTFLLAGWARGVWRVAILDPRPHRAQHEATPVLIVGAGEAGRQLVASMQRDPAQTWSPLAFVDDDKRKRHFKFRGVKVRGRIGDLQTVAEAVGASAVIIAIPSADAPTVKRVYELVRSVNLGIKVLPSVNEILASGVDQAAIRDIEPADLLRREPIDTDLRLIAGYLSGKRVLVTGAGGSIGSELCRQIAKFGPSKLFILDRDESALHALRLSMNGRADLESSDVVLANIREADRMYEVFEQCQPHVVFHAAALKHVNMLEGHASEAVKTNILGTLNVLQAAAAVDVERFVNISTDKSADPENVLGYSKRIAEGITAAFASRSSGTFLSVRFGNVLGTRGSVLNTFNAQIKAGGPVTVTDPDVTRYFMTVHEAVQLVIQAAAIGQDGEALVLDMGDPVKILDVARQLIDQSDKQIEVVFTGLKPGEKLNEVLFGENEPDFRPTHPLVSHVDVPPISPDEAHDLPRGRDNEANIAAMHKMSQQMRLFNPLGAVR